MPLPAAKMRPSTSVCRAGPAAFAAQMPWSTGQPFLCVKSILAKEACAERQDAEEEEPDASGFKGTSKHVLSTKRLRKQVSAKKTEAQHHSAVKNRPFLVAL